MPRRNSDLAPWIGDVTGLAEDIDIALGRALAEVQKRWGENRGFSWTVRIRPHVTWETQGGQPVIAIYFEPPMPELPVQFQSAIFRYLRDAAYSYGADVRDGSEKGYTEFGDGLAMIVHPDAKLMPPLDLGESGVHALLKEIGRRRLAREKVEITKGKGIEVVELPGRMGEFLDDDDDDEPVNNPRRARRRVR